MIKTSKGDTQISGVLAEVITDFSCITNAMFNMMTSSIGMSEESAKAELTDTFERAIEPDNSVQLDNETEIALNILKACIARKKRESEGK